jgi:hypothetical protein
MRNYKVRLYHNPETKKTPEFLVQADTIDIDPRGNCVFKIDGRIVGVVSNPAYQFVKEIVVREKTIVTKE